MEQSNFRYRYRVICTTDKTRNHPSFRREGGKEGRKKGRRVRQSRTVENYSRINPFARSRYARDRSASVRALDWISRGDTDVRAQHRREHRRAARVYVRTDTRTWISKCALEGRSAPGDGRMDGWKRIKLSVINNAA